MAVLGVVTLVLLVFTLLFYAYLANHSDHDVSFFMSAGLILLVMNLATNAGGAFGLAWLYLSASLLFLGLGFAVDRANAAAFYDKTEFVGKLSAHIFVVLLQEQKLNPAEVRPQQADTDSADRKSDRTEHEKGRGAFTRRPTASEKRSRNHFF